MLGCYGTQTFGLMPNSADSMGILNMLIEKYDRSDQSKILQLWGKQKHMKQITTAVL